MTDARTKPDTPATVLGIETSCDETSAAIVCRKPCGAGRILSNVVVSQTSDHSAYGGVVPEIAARAHVTRLDAIVSRALREANCTIGDVDAVAATAGPGLLGGVLVGLTTAKAIALSKARPLIAVNHLEGHALTPGLTEGVRPPYLLLLMSGGHTQLLAVEDVGQYSLYGTTVDDALGEAFDKVAKLLGLGYPGGPQVERSALAGNADRFKLPRPLLGRPGADFSFSGLKTAVRQAAEQLGDITASDTHDICAAFQLAVADVLADRLSNAMARFCADHPNATAQLVVSGGVAANRELLSEIRCVADQHQFALSVPPAELCTDNAAMIAWAGAERYARGMVDSLDVSARARWPLAELAVAR